MSAAMEIIVDIILPVFGIVLIGYVAARAGFFPEAAGKATTAGAWEAAIDAALDQATSELGEAVSR